MPKLKAAAGKVDLEPRIGGWMTGFASRLGPAEGIHDPIMARALVLDSGGNKLAIVACDLLGFAPDAVTDMRRRIERKASIPGRNVLICCTHTHSGPTSQPMRGVLGKLDRKWLAAAQTEIVDLVAELSSSLVPAKIAYASTSVSGVGFNRQDRTRPNDEELIAISVEDANGGTIATAVNYATHSVVLGGGYMQFSADWPGALNARIEQARGGVALYLQGACGDVNPAVELRGNYEDCEHIGETVAQAAVSALDNAPRTSEVTLAARGKIVNVPLDPPPSLDELDKRIEGFEADKKASAESGNAVQQLVAAAMLDWARELRELIVKDAVPKTISAEVFAAAINNLRIVSLPFETYNDIGVEIKRGLRPKQGMFVGYANGLFGYLPTRWAKEQGGYGPESSFYWFGELVAPIGYGADELLIREGIALAQSFYGASVAEPGGAAEAHHRGNNRDG